MKLVNFAINGFDISIDKIDISNIIPTLPTAIPLEFRMDNIYICPHHGGIMEFAVRKGNFIYCPICDKPVTILGKIKIVREEDLPDGNK